MARRNVSQFDLYILLVHSLLTNSLGGGGMSGAGRFRSYFEPVTDGLLVMCCCCMGS